MTKRIKTHQDQQKRDRRQYIVSFVVLMLFLLLADITGLFLANDIYSFATGIVYFISAVLFFGLGLAILPQRLFFYLMLPTLLLNAVEIIYQSMNHVTTSVMFIYTVVAAEPGEFLELVTTYWPLLLIFIPIVVTYICLNKFHIPNQRLLSHRSHRLLVISLIALWFVISTGVLLHHRRLEQVIEQEQEIVQTPESCTPFVGMIKSCPLNMVVQSVHLALIWDNINGHKKLLQGVSFGITKKNDDSDEVIVFLIGETARYDHMQINGYERETTPHLASRDDIVSFDSCYTIANLTAVSVPYMLSRATPREQYPYAHERSLPEAFQEAGYKTAWIADQSFTNAYLRRISSSCDYSAYLPAKQAKGPYYDSILIAPLHNLLQEPEHKRFIVVHSLGSHYKYSYRYPDEYSQFKPDLKETQTLDIFSDAIVQHNRIIPSVDSEQLLSSMREVLVNSYDNTMLYTDFFINAVIEELEQTGKPALLVYVGDHGENLMDDERLMLMHGTYAGSKWEYHVPLIVWASKQYQQQHPNKLEALNTNKQKQVSTMNLFHTFLHLAEIDYSLLDRTKCLDDTCLVSETIAWGLDANMELTVLPK